MEIVLWGVVTSSLYFFCSRALAVYWVILSASTVISYTRADSIDGRMTRVERRLTSLEATLDKFMSTVSIRFKEILPKGWGRGSFFYKFLKNLSLDFEAQELGVPGELVLSPFF